MSKRIKLAQRLLPDYTKAEEVMNMVTHIVGGALGVVALVLCVLRSAFTGGAADVVGCAVYGGCMVALYGVSSVYHGLRHEMAKKVMQVIDHCTIYFLIAGTYTPILLSAFVPAKPLLGWGLLAAQWGICALAVTLTAVDLKKYTVFSMICYIGMGWMILPFLSMTVELLTIHGFWLLLGGGIAYTVGAVLYGVGSKVHWMHSVFHIFVVLGSLLQFLSIFFYVI